LEVGEVELTAEKRGAGVERCSAEQAEDRIAKPERDPGSDKEKAEQSGEL
jgi:hypothetical protein